MPKETRVKLLGSLRPGTRAQQASVGRNARCPCGSGKKYKKCCLVSKAASGHALARRLMSVRIDRLPNEEAFSLAATLTQLGIDLDCKEYCERASTHFESLEKRDLSVSLRTAIYYTWANTIAGLRYGTEWQWEQKTLARETYLLRKAISNPEFSKVEVLERCKALNNLGNRLHVAGRIVEALVVWRRALSLESSFGMALCCEAQALSLYASSLESGKERALFLWMAHKKAVAALAPRAIYTDRRDRKTMEAVGALKTRIEAAIDTKKISEVVDSFSMNPSLPVDERAYRDWCLANTLFLSPLNDLGSFPMAAADTLQLPSHAIRVDSPNIFESFFHQMKQEYVSARYMAYEGITSREVHFSDLDVFHPVSEPRPSLALAVERLKASYRICYSLFDKIAFFINAYMEIELNERDISFRSVWRKSDKQPLRSQFDTRDKNWGFCALSWLSRDFFENESDEVAEPEAKMLRQIRNHLEHKYLRVTVRGSSVGPPDDLGLNVSRADFQDKCLYLLSLGRAALVYLSAGVKAEEARRMPGRAGISIEELPVSPALPDDEKK